MTTITTINQKGGVGKTTVTALAGEALGNACPVLLIDLDPLGTLSDIMLPRYNRTAQRTVTDWLQGRAALADAAVRLTEGLHILPADNGLEDVLADMSAHPAKVFDLRDAIGREAHQYGLILIDAPPSLSALAWAAIIAADMIVVPTLADRTSVKGLKNILKQIEDVRANLGMAPTLIGVVANMVDERVVGDREALAQLAERGMPEVLGKLPRRRGRDALPALRRAFSPIAHRLREAICVRENGAYGPQPMNPTSAIT